DDEIAVHGVRAAAVLLDPGPGIEPLRREAGHRPVGIVADENLAAAFVRSALQPPADPVARRDLAEPDGALRQELDRERRLPGTEGRNALLSHRTRSTSRAATMRRRPSARQSSRR